MTQRKATNLKVTKANVAAVANPVTRTMLDQDRRIIFTLIVGPDLISLFTLDIFTQAETTHVTCNLLLACCMTLRMLLQSGLCFLPLAAARKSKQ